MKAAPPYNAGELAGFEGTKAQKLVNSGKAVYRDAAATEAAQRNAEADGAGTDNTLLGSSTLAAVLTVTEGVTITLGELVAKAFDASGLSIEEWNGLDEKARDLHLEDLLETLRAEAGKPGEGGQGGAPEGGEGTTTTFTARHVGAGRYKVFDADDKPVTEAMDKDSATAEAALRNAEQGA
ncbi:hypothetical protein [Magnetospirillum aberrantis]|uniref:Uncharacterized protein n=1 Tax=Magnetospirillum aberrantis SpK TaxID=908842 RepID=A0A7C9QT45_9PROT|nr:hypothetical protein [Magnetospirillum aberrantis]NFV80003.1 hypothetical protein [Magnetospirillum aberrantis SpK]